MSQRSRGRRKRGTNQRRRSAAFGWTKVNEIIFVSSGLEHTHDGDDDERRTEQGKRRSRVAKVV